MVLKITDPAEKRNLLMWYASEINTTSLRKFSQKRGYGNEYMHIFFKADLEEDPYEFSQELAEIRADQVLLEVDQFLTPSGEDEIVYLDFTEFYAYLYGVVMERIEASPKDEAEYLELLEAVKKTLGIFKTPEKYPPNLVEEKNKILKFYRSYIHKESLREFSKKQGGGSQRISLWFKEELEKYPEVFRQELAEIRADQVLFIASSPLTAATGAKLYLDFVEFYAYLYGVVMGRIEASPKDEAEYLELLKTMKKTLGLPRSKEPQLGLVRSSKDVDHKEKEVLLKLYRHFLYKDTLSAFSQRTGDGDYSIRIYFKEELEKYPYSFRQELAEIKADQVVLLARPPAAPVEEKLYLDFAEFYAYLESEVERRIQKKPADKAEYLELLLAVKTTLGLGQRGSKKAKKCGLSRFRKSE